MLMLTSPSHDGAVFKIMKNMAQPKLSYSYLVYNKYKFPFQVVGSNRESVLFSQHKSN
jgi:hypothetical protein